MSSLICFLHFTKAHVKMLLISFCELKDEYIRSYLVEVLESYPLSISAVCVTVRDRWRAVRGPVRTRLNAPCYFPALAFCGVR